ncbi:MAG TPA: hypothetical protein VLH94_00700 [Spirochaetia bacterium]|nr:hypothetical protein [Spirochaetia bacterium]
MARMKETWELVAENREYEKEKKNHKETSIKKYGDTLGTAYHQYIYGEHRRTFFFQTIAQILETGSVEEKALALSVMFEASEQHTEKMIQEAIRNINPVY